MPSFATFKFWRAMLSLANVYLIIKIMARHASLTL